ncbi:MAG: phage head-tail connector protein [Planctomycetaceae bacterium]|nr:phage head-tail connector protein [Planctomycetaceae bacterium]
MESILLVTAFADTLPMTLANMKEHLRITHSSEDDYITDLMWSAYQWIEEEAQITMSTTEYVLLLDDFPLGKIFLPKPPLVSIDSVTYYDSDNNSQSLVENTDFYLISPSKQKAFLLPVSTSGWPVTYERPDAISIAFTCGADSLNLELQLMRLLVGGMYENREAEVSGTITSSLKLGIDRLMPLVKTWEYV